MSYGNRVTFFDINYITIYIRITYANLNVIYSQPYLCECKKDLDNFIQFSIYIKEILLQLGITTHHTECLFSTKLLLLLQSFMIPLS